MGKNVFSQCPVLKIYVENADNIKKWDENWNPDNLPIFDAKTGRQLKKTLFGGWK